MWERAAQDAEAYARAHPITGHEPIHLDWIAIGGVALALALIFWFLRAIIFGDTSGLGPPTDPQL